MNFSWELLNKLENEFGSSFYILDLPKFEANYKDFLSAFSSIYPKTRIAYSYKTNYIPQICTKVNELGGYAEVVSRMEFDLARRIGVKPKQIILNGPVKFQNDFDEAILEGSVVNLDSFYEIDFLKGVARRYPSRSISIGIRCNFDIGEEKRSHFGFESDDLPMIFRELDGIENIKVVGLHCHFSTQSRSVDSFELRTRKILELAKKYFKNGPPKYLDIGGGFFGRMPESLSRQFSFPIPSFKDYARSVTKQFLDFYENDEGPELFIEPGMAIVADTMQFVARIVGVKTIYGQNYAVAAGTAFNTKPLLHDKNLPLKIFSHQENRANRYVEGVVDIIGFTCMEGDYLYKKFSGRIHEGDYVMFDQVGGYSIVLNPPFINPFPAIVAFDLEKHGYYLVRRPGNFEDVFTAYSF